MFFKQPPHPNPLPKGRGDKTILIAAYSGRALAQSARRAGYVPLVADAFGDLDMREAAEHYVHLPSALKYGFDARTLIAALDELTSKSARAPIGLVVGSGFEDRPRLLQRLDHTFVLFGTPASTVSELKHPMRFAVLCKRLDIPHPETTLIPPATPAGWLSKHIGGTSGGHVRRLTGACKANKRRYFQRELVGTSASLFAIVSRSMSFMSPTRQWCTATPARPFRYGGAVTAKPSDVISGQMQDSATKIIKAVELAGIVSFDFRIDDSTAYLLEVNPRPGATLDLFDSIEVPLFKAHLDACQDATFDLPPPRDEARLSALLYGSRNAVMPNINWPDWSADRTPPGTSVAPGQPLATVFANAATPDEAQALGRERLAILSDLIYRKST